MRGSMDPIKTIGQALSPVAIPIIRAADFPSDACFELVRANAYGYADSPPQPGFSFLVKTGYIDGTLEDMKIDIANGHAEAKELEELAVIRAIVGNYPFFIVCCDNDDFSVTS